MQRALKTIAFVLTIASSLMPASAAIGPFDVVFTEVASGVWAGVRPDGPRFPVMGSTTFVISDEGVVVFDGGGMPIMAEKVIEKIRSLTEAPVTHVVISHWHGDHNFGIHRYGEEFPNVQIVAHTFTRAVMTGSRIRYVDGYATFMERNLPTFQKALETGAEEDGTPLNHTDRVEYQRIIDDADEVDLEYKRARVTVPTIVFDQELTIYSGSRRIDFIKLGHGNTEGDIVMWLPEEKVVAAGDLVVMPTPYAFNVPPRPWAEALRGLNALGYDVLVPGHGEILRDTRYVDLNIEVAEDIADQRDALVVRGVAQEEIAAMLDFTGYEERFTDGDEYLSGYYKAYFERPFRLAAVKALTGEPMVPVERPGN